MLVLLKKRLLAILLANALHRKSVVQAMSAKLLSIWIDKPFKPSETLNNNSVKVVKKALALSERAGKISLMTDCLPSGLVNVFALLIAWK